MSRAALPVPPLPASSERCLLHDLQWCADCRPKAPVPSAPARVLRRPNTGLGPWFHAGHTSEDGCSGCAESIWVDDRIRADGEGGWLCEVCGDTAE